MTLTFGKYTITLTLRKVTPSKSIPTNSEIMKREGCDLRTAMLKRGFLLQEAQNDKRKAQSKALGII